MMNELQRATGEISYPVNTSNTEIKEISDSLSLLCNPAFVKNVNYPQDIVLDSERTLKFMDEIVAMVKDDRMNTKKDIC